MPTSTVGKITDIKDVDGKVWAKLDHTNLWYDVQFLDECDPKEYKTVLFKYREGKGIDSQKFIDDLKNKEDVDISGFSPTA